MNCEKFTRNQSGNILVHCDRSDPNRTYKNQEIDHSKTYLNYNLAPEHTGMTDYEFMKKRCVLFILCMMFLVGCSEQNEEIRNSVIEESTETESSLIIEEETKEIKHCFLEKHITLWRIDMVKAMLFLLMYI
mgnify:CR=1 FL=1